MLIRLPGQTWHAPTSRSFDNEAALELLLKQSPDLLPGTASFLVIRNFEVRVGTKAGQKFEIAIQRSTAVPYVLPPAIHVRPHAISMGLSLIHI